MFILVLLIANMLHPISHQHVCVYSLSAKEDNINLFKDAKILNVIQMLLHLRIERTYKILVVTCSLMSLENNLGYWKSVST